MHTKQSKSVSSKKKPQQTHKQGDILFFTITRKQSHMRVLYPMSMKLRHI